MKHKMRIISAVTLAGALLFAGCSDQLNDSIQAEQGSLTGNVRIQIGSGGDARTLLPTTTGSFDSYKVEFLQGSEVIIPAVEAPNGVYNGQLAAGEWTVKATGFKTGKALVSGTNTITVGAGQDTTVNITLDTNVDTAPGTFHYELKFPTSVTYTAAVLTMTPDDADNEGTVTVNLKDTTQFNAVELVYENSSGVTVSGGTPGSIQKYKVSGNIILPPGQYTMDIKLVSNRVINNIPAAVYEKETVYIYPGLTTSTASASANYNTLFTDAYFSANVYLSGTANTSGTVYVSKNRSTTLKQVVTTGTNNSWNLTLTSAELANSSVLYFRINSGRWQGFSITEQGGRQNITLVYNGSGYTEEPIEEGVWTETTTLNSSTPSRYYTIPVSAGKSYYIEWDLDSSTYLTVTGQNGTTYLGQNLRSSLQRSITPSSADDYIIVEMERYYTSSSYKIRYREYDPTELQNSEEKTDSFLIGQPHYYTFYARAGRTYYLYLNNTSITAPLYMTTSRQDGTSYGKDYVSSSGSNTETITPTSDGYITVRIEAYSSSYPSGSYRIWYYWD